MEKSILKFIGHFKRPPITKTNWEKNKIGVFRLPYSKICWANNNSVGTDTQKFLEIPEINHHIHGQMILTRVPRPSLAVVAQLFGVSSHTLKDDGFYSWSGNITQVVGLIPR